MLTILVTGATGNVGQEVIRLLLNQNCQVRAAVRNPDTATEILSVHPTAGFSDHSIDRVPFNFTNPATFATAFQGVDKLFLVRPPNLANVRKQIAPALEAAKRAGVKQVVFLSILGADRNPILPHSKIESYINRLGIPATFLRASFFMQNLNTTHKEEIKTRGELVLPAGHGRTSFIDVRDIAAVAVRTLMEDGHSHKAYTLTGGEALTYYEVADIFTAVLGKPIHYTNLSVWNFIKQMRDRGLPMDFITVMVGIYTTARLGLASHVTPDVEQLLARPPLTVRQYVEDYRQFWL
ncbi:NAD(P)H-binding protein [Scytonema sp. UIC 10036]|uniref:SDR family oxidoreductase n=1 Tax=Scytonema sp. UIC 10036 TaxID=2304196 RepID=UPI0012DA2A73|nr:SDR family oxidoreductase [Scytonema sp. UIC 10036]MUG94396.1 NAD(P)H-binding protein [Scytonema sp. UIC 10036]